MLVAGFPLLPKPPNTLFRACSNHTVGAGPVCITAQQAAQSVLDPGSSTMACRDFLIAVLAAGSAAFEAVVIRPAGTLRVLMLRREQTSEQG